uniref:Sodium-dependent nutrient amino acid transporter 1 n=1 Tax=Megaselia scalaris TaxID=36166 RepID=T1GP88_MEGSC
SLNSIIGHYIYSSFKSPLPWAKCREEWGPNCVNSDGTPSTFKFDAFMAIASNKSISSSELYFNNIVLQERDNIDDGIGVPNWPLVITLFLTWVIVLMAIIKGVRSSGKASYFLAIFPYIILIILLIRAVTLEGALEGILFFIKPQWDKLLSPQVSLFYLFFV